METKRLLALFILSSIAGHALVLSLATHVPWGAAPTEQRALKVELKGAEAPPVLQMNRRPPTPKASRQAGQTGGGGLREESVHLESRGSRYNDYLLVVRKKIEALWRYPDQALAEKHEGNAVIHFTIEADGSLTGYQVRATSGSPALDEGALAVVRAAAPYAPLPEKYRLSRLNITATFSYQLEP